MKTSSRPTTIPLLCSMLLISFLSKASSLSVKDNFVQCLYNHSHPSHPISESIYLANNTSFQSVLQSYVRNLRYMTSSTPKPLVLVAAKDESHVQHTVLCAKNVGLEIRIRSGGHDYEGVSYVSHKPFIVLDMFNLRSIDIDIANETAWVQSGATLGEIYYGIANKSKYHAFPAGVCPTLGAGGHFTGGGYGNLMRKFGLSVDNIVDAKIVDAKGRILDRKSMGEDLFWAIRGGGASSFGVILSWKINLVKIPDIVTVFKVKRTLEQGATGIVLQWQQVADKLHEDLFVRLIVKPVNGSEEGGDEKTIEASFVGMFLGQSELLRNLTKQNFPKLGLEPKHCIEMSWVESLLFWAEFPNGTPPEVLLDRNPNRKIFFKYKSDYVKEIIPRDGLEAIWKAVIEGGEVVMQWNPYGGKMSEISETETPFPHRKGNIFKIQYLLNWMEDGIEATNHHLNLSRKLHEAMTPYVSSNPREAFLNYRDFDIGTSSVGKYDEGRVYGMKYFKGNFDRLVKVKTVVDPDNFFRNEQSIPTHP